MKIRARAHEGKGPLWKAVRKIAGEEKCKAEFKAEMRQQFRAKGGRIQGDGVVRGPDGRPVIDDISKLTPGQMCMLTEQERADLGLWPKEIARDAQGIKRLEKVGAREYRCVDPLVAVQTVYDDGEAYHIATRRDVPAGETIILE